MVVERANPGARVAIVEPFPGGGGPEPVSVCVLLSLGDRLFGTYEAA